MVETIEPVGLGEENTLVSECWDLVIQHTNRILHHAGVYGYQLMQLPDPNINALLNCLKVLIVPVLRELDSVGTINPMNGVKINTMAQIINCICDITIALKEENQARFLAAVEELRKQPFIH